MQHAVVVKQDHPYAVEIAVGGKHFVKDNPTFLSDSELEEASRTGFLVEVEREEVVEPIASEPVFEEERKLTKKEQRELEKLMKAEKSDNEDQEENNVENSEEENVEPVSTEDSQEAKDESAPEQ